MTKKNKTKQNPKSPRMQRDAPVKKSCSSFRTNNGGLKASSGPRSHPCDTLIVVFLQQMFGHARLTSAENSGCEHYYSLFEMHSCTARTSAPKQEAKTVTEWPVKYTTDVKSAPCVSRCVCVCVCVFLVAIAQIWAHSFTLCTLDRFSVCVEKKWNWGRVLPQQV